jgi:hypothetical protein
VTSQAQDPGRPGPLRAVLEALRDGAPTLEAVRTRTGLDRGIVDAAVSHLVRSGHVAATRLTLGCSSGCGGCPSRSGCAGGPGAGAAEPNEAPVRTAGGRPQLLALRVR